ncbi:MAG: hypothetical protein GYB41_08885 [Oceanospirillales bacterium]|nr:hypothetical protein [Oceanospirillales bacterium]
MTAILFRVSRLYIRQQQAKQLLWVLLMLALVAGSGYFLTRAEAVVDYLLPVLGVAACSAYLVKLVQLLKRGASGYPDVEVDVSAGTLKVLQETPVVLNLSNILNMRIQVALTRVLAITLVTEAGEQLRLEGYERMDELVAALEAVLPEDRVIRTRLRY